ncbi:MAG: GPW/gp25 family protein [Bacteroidales bacterium]|nr:GPW/gp25 family protein [Bacteroidales bacterium]
MSDYYSLPLNLSDLIGKKESRRCSLSESVSYMCQLITTSRFGEFKHDNSFGCEIWEHDFENIFNTQLYKDQLKKSIQQTIEKHEPRLSDVRADIQIEQIESRVGNRRTKSRIRLQINGSLTRTNEPFTFNEQFFIGPLSYEL